MASQPETDEDFYHRADAHIKLSNEHLANETRGKVSASMLYSVARFNAWLTACGFATAEDMKAKRDETIEYFANEYREMLAANLDDYITNFDDYMAPEN